MKGGRGWDALLGEWKSWPFWQLVTQIRAPSHRAGGVVLHVMMDVVVQERLRRSSASLLDAGVLRLPVAGYVQVLNRKITSEHEGVSSQSRGRWNTGF